MVFPPPTPGIKLLVAEPGVIPAGVFGNWALIPKPVALKLLDLFLIASYIKDALTACLVLNTLLKTNPVVEINCKFSELPSL